MRIIKKVNINKTTGQLTITIPKDSGISVDDYVEVFLVPETKPANKEEKENDEGNKENTATTI